MQEDCLKVTGHIEFVVKDLNGNVKQRHSTKNIVTTVGKAYLAAWLAQPSQSTPFMTYVGLGTGTSPASATDTALQAELTVAGYSRALAALSSVSTSWVSESIFPAGDGTATITEAGIFSAATGGTLFAHQVFSPIGKTATDELTITWSVTFS